MPLRVNIHILLQKYQYVWLQDAITHLVGGISEVTKASPTLCDSMDCVAHQAPPSMEFSRQEYWTGLPFPSTSSNPTILTTHLFHRSSTISFTFLMCSILLMILSLSFRFLLFLPIILKEE